MNRNIQLWRWASVVFFFLAACGGGGEVEDKSAPEATNEQEVEDAGPSESAIEEAAEAVAEPTQSDAVLGEADVVTLLAANQLELGSLYANVDEETTGPILTMQLVNQSDGELIVEIPCGLIFIPDDDGEQPLMVLESQTITIRLDEEVEFTPYVVCADIIAGAPSLSATYTVGTLTEDGQLQQLVECICDKGFDTSLYAMDGVNVQFAIWFVQMDGDPAGFIETMMDEMPEEEMEELVGSDEDVAAFIEMLEVFGNEWLTECGIEFEG